MNGLAVGVDLGGSNMRAALVETSEGALVSPELKAPVGSHDPEAVAALVGELVARADPDGRRAGVGIGFAGMLRGWSGVVVNGPNFGWREVDFRTLVRRHVGARAELYNDLNAIAYGEARYGAARGVGDVLCVYVGTGVGAGLVCDGRLYIGATHLAGELGHTKVVLPGPAARLCGCGQRGCLEAYTSGRNVQARAREELGAGATSLAVELAGDLESLHAGHLDQAAARGDAYAARLWDEVAAHLAIALANAVTTLNPSRLVMGGGAWQGAPELRRRTLALLATAINAPAQEGFSVVDTTLGDQAGFLGAAALIAQGGAP